VAEEKYWSHIRDMHPDLQKTFVYLQKENTVESGKKEFKIKKKGGKKEIHYIPLGSHESEILSHLGHEGKVLINRYKNFYLDNPYFGKAENLAEESFQIQNSEEGKTEIPGKNLRVLAPPPINKLYNVYGVNVPTETVYFYKKVLSEKELYLDTTKLEGDPLSGFFVKGGIGYECERKFPTKLTSGDGTVPYTSLSYADGWKDKLEYKKFEIPNAEHQSSVCTEELFDIIVPIVCNKSN